MQPVGRGLLGPRGGGGELGSEGALNALSERTPDPAEGRTSPDPSPGEEGGARALALPRVIVLLGERRQKAKKLRLLEGPLGR